MADYTIFYSWQMDAPVSINKAFIREAIDSAVAQLSANTVTVEPSPRVDSGMDEVAGTPEVATVLLEKIKDSAIFVGDVTLVGKIDRVNDSGARTATQKTLNPNVAIEMAYAAALSGWDRIICVMNEAKEFGKRREQPFDVRNKRFPIDYTLSLTDAQTGSKRKDQLASLSASLMTAIEAVEKNELRKVEAVASQLDVRCLELMGFYRGHGSFPEPTPALMNMNLSRFHSAAVRLLELKILFANFDPAKGSYAYHWSYLGTKVLSKLRFR